MGRALHHVTIRRNELRLVRVYFNAHTGQFVCRLYARGSSRGLFQLAADDVVAEDETDALKKADAMVANDEEAMIADTASENLISIGPTDV